LIEKVFETDKLSIDFYWYVKCEKDYE